MDRTDKNQSGSVILYALLVMALITAIGIGISIVMIRELKLTQNIHYASLAYYASESGIEKGLYKIRVARDNKELSDTLSAIKNYKPGTDPNANNFGNSATYDDNKTQNITQEFTYNLEQDQTIQVDLYDPDTGGSLGAQSVTFSWENEATWIEVSYIKWSGNIPVSLDKLSVDRRLFSGSMSGTADSLLALDSTYSYRIRVRAYFSDAKNLKIIAYNCPNPYEEGSGCDANHIVNIRTRIVVNSVGKKDDFSQSLTATVPWKVPIFGLYDYAVFSEGEVKKTEIVGSGIYSSGPVQVEDKLGTTQCNSCGNCQTNGWLGNCSGNGTLKCNQTNETGWCSMENTGVPGLSFTLTIPSYIPDSEKMFLSLGLRFATDRTEKLQVGISNNPTSATINDLGDQNFFSCTVTSPETFDLRTSLPQPRTITFTNESSGASDWWSSGNSYQSRRQLTIPDSYQKDSIMIKFDGTTTPDANTMYNASQSPTKGDDFRIVYMSNEIDRNVISFTSSNIEIWFRVQADTPGDNTNYFLYYGNTTPGSLLNNKNNVYTLWDDFTGETIDATKWTTYFFNRPGYCSEGGSSITQNNVLQLNHNTPAQCWTGASAYTTNSYSKSGYYTVLFDLNPEQSSNAGNHGVYIRNSTVNRDTTVYGGPAEKAIYTSLANNCSASGIRLYSRGASAAGYNCAWGTNIGNINYAFNYSEGTFYNFKILLNANTGYTEIYEPTGTRRVYGTAIAGDYATIVNNFVVELHDAWYGTSGSGIEKYDNFLMRRGKNTYDPQVSSVGSQEQPGGKVLIDWYQLTGYKVFGGCP